MQNRLNDIFPGSFGVDKPFELIFHVDSSEVVDWEIKREDMCQEEPPSQEDTNENFANDFQVMFPQPYKPSEMACDVEIYMKEVEDMIRKLKHWFPPPSGSITHERARCRRNIVSLECADSCTIRVHSNTMGLLHQLDLTHLQ
ncbi:hypothetical protein V8E55_002979 [Tylopilus felleus]